MTATGARRGHLVYHWKHGWIPLDHFAALSKAHHSESGAVKVMQKHGIDVPKGYSSDHRPSAPKALTHSAGIDPHAANPVGKDFRSMTTAEKVQAAAVMYGSGSKQHLAAIKKFGGAAKVAAPKVDPHAMRAAQLRDAAAKKRAEADRIAGSVGAPDRAGAMLRAKDSARMNARMDSGLRRFTEKQREASALESKARLAEGRSKTAAEKQRAADLGVTASKLSPGDVIVHKGSIHFVQKVNKTTVSVPSGVGGPWEDKVPISGISRHVPVATMKDENLRKFHAASSGKARAALEAEMKRRGLRP